MNAPHKHDAAIKFTDSSQPAIHYLGGKIRNPVSNPVRHVDEFWSSDLTTVRRVAVGSGVYDLSGTLPWDGSPDSLNRFIMSALGGATLEYFPSLANPSLSFPCVLVSAGEIRPDAEFWHARRFAVDVRLRRIDGGSWQSLLEEPLFYYRAGNLFPGLTFTRTGTAPYIDHAGARQSAAADKFRTEWLDLDGDEIRETPALLIGTGLTNLVSSDDFDAGWTSSGTPLVADGITDPFGGTDAFRIEDDSAVASEGKVLTVAFTGDAVKVVSFTVRERVMPSAGNQLLKLQDTTAGASRLSLSISAWVDGEPTVTAVTGTFLGKLYRGNGYWTLFARTTAVTAANTNRLEIFPAETAGETGSIEIYRANAFDSVNVPSYTILDAAGVLGSELLYGTFPWGQRPLTIYVKFLEAGSGFFTSANTGIVHIGGAASGDDPRCGILHNAASTAGCYQFFYDNGIEAAVTATIANGDALAYGDVGEMLCHFDYLENDTGALRISQSKDSGTVTTPVTAAGPASGVQPLSKLWNLNPARIHLGSRGSGERGCNPIICVKVLDGIADMAAARAA